VLGVAAASAVATTDLVVSGTAYTVAALERDLARQPGPWLGRALLVRARLGACSSTGANPASPCADWQPALVDLGAEATEAPLPLTAGGQEWRLALVRAIPVLGLLVPPPQRLRWDGPATYRIALRAVPCGAAGESGCYAAVLLDADRWDRAPTLPAHGARRNAPRPSTS
jgi:hypothetical protein